MASSIIPRWLQAFPNTMYLEEKAARQDRKRDVSDRAAKE